MKKLYRKLRAKLMEYDIDQIYLAEILGRGATYVSLRMTAKKAWSMDDMYKMMDELNIPYNEMHIYFPKNGKEVKLEDVCKQRLRVMRVG